MQCMVEILYSVGANGSFMFSYKLLEAATSTLKKTPLGLSAFEIDFKTRVGWAWSWIESKAVMRSYRFGSSNVATSFKENLAFDSFSRLASSFAAVIPCLEKS